MRALVILATFLLTACLSGGSGQQRSSSDSDELDEFRCKGRRAEYLLVGGFVATEMGIQIQCAEDRPSLTKWTADDTGAREKATYPMSRAAFEETWRAFEDAGWRNLGDCGNTAAKDDDPIYTFDINNDDATVAFTCQGKPQPFPFDRLVNALDLAAGASVE